MTPEEIKEYNLASKKEFEKDNRESLLGYTIPFFLFWGGILTPFITDEFLVLLCSLIPFYTFVLAGKTVFKNKVDDQLFAMSLFLGTASSVLLFILSFVIPENWEMVQTCCTMGTVNIIPSAMFLFIEEAFDQEFSWGMMFPPFFVTFKSRKKD